MKVRRRSVRTLTAVAVVFVALAGWTAVEAATEDRPNSDRPSGPVLSGPALRAAVAGNSTTEDFSGIAPCRILDTRKTTPMNSVSRNFKVSGNLTSQGGAASCGIPAHATSVVVNLTGISNGGTGYVRGWAAGSTPPNATLLNFSPALNASNQVTIPLCRGASCPNAFTLRTYGKANIVGDAVGYHSSPMFAAITPTGTVYKDIQSGLVSVTRVGVGQYNLEFDRSVLSCAWTATSITWSSNIDPSPDGSQSATPNTVKVQLVNAANEFRDDWFYVTSDC